MSPARQKNKVHKRYEVKMQSKITMEMVFDAESEEQAYDFAHNFLRQTDGDGQTKIANTFIDNAEVISITRTNKEAQNGKIRGRQ